MRSNEKLQAGQRDMRATMDALQSIANIAELPDMAMLTELRWRFARTLLRHLPLKDRIVYARIRAHPDPKVAAIGERYSVEAEAMYEGFIAHHERWTPDIVAAEWPSYRFALIRTIDILDERIQREERELIPILSTAPEVPDVRRPGDRNWAADGWRIRALLGLDEEEVRATA